jgi:hypothetical protein
MGYGKQLNRAKSNQARQQRCFGASARQGESQATGSPQDALLIVEDPEPALKSPNKLMRVNGARDAKELEPFRAPRDGLRSVIW